MTGWLLEDEARALELLARQNERSMAAELRLAIRAHLDGGRKAPAEASA